MRLQYIILIFILFISSSCSNNPEIKSTISEKSLDLQVFEAYKKGMTHLESGDVLFAAKKFNEAEILFPQSEWAPKASLMAAYSYYTQDYYVDTIAELERFFKVYPNHVNLDYARYMHAIAHYEQIVDEKKDLKSILDSKEGFEYVIKNFPNTDYALDSSFKLNLVKDFLAAKEMYVGRYYFNKQKWISAINRFRTVIDDYETTIYVEEALHRMVELNYVLGLNDEAERYAILLGYNYQSSKWYENTYKVFNKKYEKISKKKDKDKKKSIIILKKFKSLFN